MKANTIFINQCAVSFISSMEDAEMDGSILLFRCTSEKSMEGFLDFMDKQTFAGKVTCYLLNENIFFLQKMFMRFFIHVKAAGGMVMNRKGELLLILRYDAWDLPKGKVETGETLHQAALREVEEECGVSGLSIEAPLTDTYHTYKLEGKRMLKNTSWFIMKSSSVQNPSPQASEQITKAEWVTVEEAGERLNSSYATLREVFKEFLKAK